MVAAGAAALAALALVAVAAARGASARARATRGLPTPVRDVRAVPVPSVLRLAVTDLAVGVSPETVWVGWLTAGAIVPMLAFVAAGPALAALAAAAIATAPPVVWKANRGRRAARYEAALPVALEAVARSLRSGAVLKGALEEAAATNGVLGADLLDVVRSAGVVGLAAALEEWRDRRPLAGVRLAVAALSLGVETGGAQARAVDGVATTLRQRLAVAAEARALAAQARASAAVIAVAPLAFSALASSTDPRVAAFLFRSGAGVAVLAAGLLLDALGAIWMARLTRVNG